MDTQTRLLDVALSLFAQAGYENVGTQKIVTEAEVKKPTLYYHFGSKQGLLVAVLDRFYSPFLNELEQQGQQTEDLTGTLEAMVNHYFEAARTHPEAYRLGLSLMYASAQSEGFQAMQPYFQQQRQLLSDFFVAVVPRHGNLRGRHDFLSVAFLGAIHAQITAAFSDEVGLERLTSDHAFRTCKQFIHGIYAG